MGSVYRSRGVQYINLTERLVNRLQFIVIGQYDLHLNLQLTQLYISAIVHFDNDEVKLVRFMCLLIHFATLSFFASSEGYYERSYIQDKVFNLYIILILL